MAHTYSAQQTADFSWMPVVDGNRVWISYDCHGSYEKAFEAARKLAAKMDAEDAVRAEAQAACATFKQRAELEAAGYRRGTGDTTLGHRAVVGATGQWRQGVITKVTRQKVTVAVVTPSNRARVQFVSVDFADAWLALR